MLKNLSAVEKVAVVFFCFVILMMILDERPSQEAQQPQPHKVVKIEPDSRFTCEMPPGVSEYPPLTHLSQGDIHKATLAREYIELERRKKISDGQWYLAATFFLVKENDHARNKGNLKATVEKIEKWQQAERNTNSSLFGRPLNEVIDGELDFYRESCNRYIQGNQDRHKLQPKLEKLRQEKNRPWLDKSLPCDVQSSPGCTY